MIIYDITLRMFTSIYSLLTLDMPRRRGIHTTKEQPQGAVWLGGGLNSGSNRGCILPSDCCVTLALNTFSFCDPTALELLLALSG